MRKFYNESMEFIERMSLFLIFLLVLLAGPLWGAPFSEWNHQSGVESYLSSAYGVADLSFILGEGIYRYFDSSQELSVNYQCRMDYHNSLGRISFGGLGGMYQYNSIPHFIVGLKGALDDNRLIEVYDNWFIRSLTEDPYPRKSGKYVEEINYGIKLYGDLLFKPYPKITWGFWNQAVLGDDATEEAVSLTGEETADFASDLSLESPALYLQSTPRGIYELRGEHQRFVGEVYMDNRVYLGKTITVEEGEYQAFYKVVVVPQWIVDWHFAPFHLFVYSAFQGEKFQHLDYIQWTFKTSPDLSWEHRRWRGGLSGGGYEFQEEIGITFDNNEFIAYKKASSYSLWVLAFKGRLFYDLTPSLTAGVESGYRGALYRDDGDEGLWEEYFFIASAEFSRSLNDRWTMTLKGSGEGYLFNGEISEDLMLPSENVLRLSLMFSH
ncbi:MAG: hypothetical protein PQJ60_07255 [Spirochaetales bacterium]|nr:hypothetical protein [Spirochaetales bacterium]